MLLVEVRVLDGVRIGGSMIQHSKSVMCRVCLDVITSEHRHDFKKCQCGAIAIDGGSDYTRCIGNPENFMWDFEEQND